MTTPNARVIVPREATEEMWEAGESAVSESFSMKYGKRAAAREIYNAMLAASPNAGEVTEEELEKAAEAASAVDHDAFVSEKECPTCNGRGSWMSDYCDVCGGSGYNVDFDSDGYELARLRAALSAIGIEVG